MVQENKNQQRKIVIRQKVETDIPMMMKTTMKITAAKKMAIMTVVNTISIDGELNENKVRATKTHKHTHTSYIFCAGNCDCHHKQYTVTMQPSIDTCIDTCFLILSMFVDIHLNSIRSPYL
mmetsp:Transcript_1853/g.2684  ORF Transcript_1853/g.2684 Transcript_1853/m.2684 type:complete len:121 (-) Transcript_1853:29-391(-)